VSDIDKSVNVEALGLLKRQAARRPEFFEERGMDQLFSVVMELAAEVWVLRERIYAHEAVALEAGMPGSEAIEAWQASEDQRLELAEMRHQMFQSLFRTIDTGAPPVSDDGETADPIPPGTRVK
jgi:hypothetical protein